MTKFAVGYNIENREAFNKAVVEFHDSISDVYCAWPGEASGREKIKLEIKEQLINDLKAYSQLGIHFNLLFNAACYGDNALSKEFWENLDNIIAEVLNNDIYLTSVTCISPLIAHFLKRTYSNLEVTASVNSLWDHISQFDEQKNYFDAFYLNRGFNRDLKEIQKFSSWCKTNNKKLYTVVNSGCLRFCSLALTHQNLESHISLKYLPIEQNKDFILTCKQKFYNNIYEYLSATSFIRPEDIPTIEPYFDKFKIATRVTRYPYEVIKSYATKQMGAANLLALTEPAHDELILPLTVDNSKISPDWYKTVLNCQKDCQNCQYCKETLKQAFSLISSK